MGWFNYYEEVPASSKKRHSCLHDQAEVFVLCGVICLLTLSLTLVGILVDSAMVHCLTALGTLLIVMPAFHLVLRPEIAKVNTFLVLQSAMSLSISGGAFYFYTDGPEQYPEGPHFSVTFFTTSIGVISSLTSLLGLAIYNSCMRDWQYRSLLCFGELLSAAFSLPDVIFFTRLNERLGIPDTMFVLGAAAARTVIYQW